MPPSQQFTWNLEAQRFVDSRGRFVSRERAVDALDAALDKAKLRGRVLATQLQAGKVSLQEWEEGMRQVVKEVHLYSAAVARGGWAQMSYTDFGNVGPTLRFQYQKLNAFAAEIAAGYPLDGRFLQRTDLYLLSGRTSFHKQDEVVQREAGKREERNLLRARDYCHGCLAESGRGWVPIGSLVPVGQRTCLSRCKCFVEYR